MEKRDLYDINKQKTNISIFKEQLIPENKYILNVSVLIQNSKNEILLQKRSKEKGGKFGLTAGHPKAGETSLLGMCTEIKEEIGLEVCPEELKLIYTQRDDDLKSFYDLYFLKKDIDIQNLEMQKEEVDYVKWCTPEEIENMFIQDTFYEPHKDAYKVFMDKI